MRSSRFASHCRRIAIAVGLVIGSCGAAQAGIIGSFTGGFTYPDTGPILVWTGEYGLPNVGVSLATGQFGPGESANLNQGGAFSWKGTLAIPSQSYSHTYSGNIDLFFDRLVTFCLEINQNIGQNGMPGSYTYGVSNDLASAPLGASGAENMGANAAAYIAELWKSHYLQALQNPTNAGAFQLAIWKLEYDANNSLASAGALTLNGGGGYNVNWNVGNLKVTSGIGTATVALATSWLNALVTPTAANKANLLALVAGGSSGYQDQLFEAPIGVNVNVVPVPEPASLISWLLVGSVTGCAGWRRGRKTAAA